MYPSISNEINVASYRFLSVSDNITPAARFTFTATITGPRADKHTGTNLFLFINADIRFSQLS